MQKITIMKFISAPLNGGRMGEDIGKLIRLSVLLTYLFNK